MKVYTILKNIITRFKSGISQCLADAKDYTDTKTAVRTWNITFTTSGVNDVVVQNNIVTGNIIINNLTIPAKSWTKVGTTTDLPIQTYVLSSVFKGSDVTYVGALAVRNNGNVEVYSINALSGTAVYGLLAYTVGGVILNLLNNRRVVFA